MSAKDDLSEQFLDMLEYKGYTRDSLDCTSRQAVSRIIKGGGYVSTLCNAVDECNYEITIKPKKK